MTPFAQAETVADAILYEGYVLYPYRASSAKNRVRFQFGVVAPRAYVDAGGSDHWDMQTEVLIEPGASPVVDLKVRFLQLQARSVEEATGEPGGTGFRPVEYLDLEGARVTAWDEGVERSLLLEGVVLSELLIPVEAERAGVAGAAGSAGGCERRIPLTAAAGWETEGLLSPAGGLCGRLVRERWPIEAAVLLSAVEEDGLVRLRVRIENHTPWPPHPTDAPLDRELALRRSLLGAHTLLALRDGAFVSLLDPPAAAARAAAGCANVHVWPVLIGEEGSRNVMLSSPIILYDHPAVAPESQGDFCDATEIDEILALRIMTLTDEEKREARGTDERSRQIVARADNMPPEIFERLHGAVRAMSPLPVEPASAAAAAPPPPAGRPELEGELASWEAFLNPPGMVPPEEATFTVGAVQLGQGSRVRLRPSRRADSMDLFLAGRTARVAAVYRDLEEQTYLAVTLDDDPAGDFHAGVGRFFYFYPDEVEPLSTSGQKGEYGHA